MRSVKVHWLVGFKQKQWLSDEFFRNITHIQTYNLTKYALCEGTLRGGLQGEAMAFRRFFFKTIYTFKHTIEQNICSVKVHWVAGSKQKQWFSETLFQNIRHIQTYKWMKYALCESTLSGGLQAEAMAFRRSFSKHYTHSNLQLIKVCALWKYSECWASSRSNGFQTKFFETLYTFKNTIEQTMLSVKVHWGVGFKQKQWLSEEIFQNIIHIQTYNWTKYALCQCKLSGGLQAETMASRRNLSKHYTRSNIQLNKVCALWKYTEWWASSRSNGFQKKFFKTIYTSKHTVDWIMRSVKVHWVVGFKQKQWLSEEYFQNIIHFQNYNWTNMRSVKVQWVVGFKQKQWFSEATFWNIIHIQTYNWIKCALCQSTLSGGLQTETMALRRSFWKQYTHSNMQMNNLCALWMYSEWWASSRSNGFGEKFFKTLYTLKHTTEQSLRSVEVHWLLGFKQKQWLA